MIGATSLILTLLFSTELFGLCTFKSFEGISSLTNSIWEKKGHLWGGNIP